jgi:hypothetical protein|tara:strand:+ start:6097 stop:6363 length:267 start_codon:yes stop_codon:yes gene_type:complete
MNEQFDRFWNLMLVIVAGIMGLIGFVIWDRKTALRPLERRVALLEEQRDTDPQIARVVSAFREYAQSNDQFADALRRSCCFSLTASAL